MKPGQLIALSIFIGIIMFALIYGYYEVPMFHDIVTRVYDYFLTGIERINNLNPY